MKISIITATYNRADTIRDTIESIIAQKYPDWEHIIIDGASTDDTLDIVKEYEEKYRGRLILISEPDNGIYDAMNKGINVANGDYIGFLNSDDFYYDDNALMSIATGIHESSADSVFGGAIAVDGLDTKKIIRVKKGSPYPKGGFGTGWHPSHPTFYARRECFERFGVFNLDFGTASDMELMIRFIERNHISTYYIPKILVSMRFGGASNSSMSALLKANNNVLRAFEYNGLKRPSFYLFKKLAPKLLNVFALKLGLLSFEKKDNL